MFEGEGVYLVTPRKRKLFSIDVVEEQVNIIKNYLWKLHLINIYFWNFIEDLTQLPSCGQIFVEKLFMKITSFDS